MFGCVLLLFLLAPGKVFGLQENQTCVEGARTCHSNATCVNYERGYCCECKWGYIGDGYQCTAAPKARFHQSCPFQELADACAKYKLLWLYDRDGKGCRRFWDSGCDENNNRSETLEDCIATCISITFNYDSYVHLTKVALDYNKPKTLRFALFLDTILWIFSSEERFLDGLAYTLSGGICNITSKIEFQNGEIATIQQRLFGLDEHFQLRMVTEVTEGSDPDIDFISALNAHTVEYYWVAHGMIKTFSTRTYRLDNVIHTYNVSQTAVFGECPFTPGRQAGYSVNTARAYKNEKDWTLYSQINVLRGLDLCRERIRICDSNADCIPELDTNRCECMKGYVGDGKTCVATIKSETKQRNATLSTYETTSQFPNIAFRKDLVFLVDGTEDMSNHFQQILRFMEDLSKDSGIDNVQLRVGLVMFGLNANVEFFLNNFTTQHEVVIAIRRIKLPHVQSVNSHLRNIAAALRIARLEMFAEKHGGRVNVPDETILITSGKSNVEANKTQEEAIKAKSSGIHITTIGLNISSNDTIKEITSIASGPNNTFIGQNPNTFTKTIREIIYRDVYIIVKENGSKDNGSNIVMIACTVAVLVFVVSVMIVGLVCFYKRFRKIHKIDEGEIINAMKYTVTEEGILSDDGLKFIASKLDAEWELLAVEMGFERSTVDQIKISLPCRGGDNMILAFLKVWRWRNFRTDKNSDNLIRVLFDSLEKCDKNNIIADICKKYGVSYKGYNARRKPNDTQLQEIETFL